MKIIREANGDLEVVNSNALLPGGLILLGGGLFCQELLKFVHGQQHLTNLKSDVPVAVSALFLVIGLALLSRSSARFDRLQQRMTWKRTGLFWAKVRVVPFRDINQAELEIDPNQFVQDHPQRGPMVRLVISTKDGPLPLAGMYTYRTSSTEKARDAINEFLGREPEESAVTPETELRVLIGQGRLIEAIHLVRTQHQCSLAEAKNIVESLRDRPDGAHF